MNNMLRKSTSTQMGKIKRTTVIADTNHVNKENARNKTITVQILTKPPTRSRTSLDLRTPPQQSAATKANTAGQQIQRFSSYSTDTHAISTNVTASPQLDFVFTQPHSHKGANNRFDDSAELDLLAASHEQVFQELRNRLATLQILQKNMRSQDMISTLKQGLKMGGHPIFVDLLGAILEKPASWNLDLCVVLLPEIYELLQSEHKFHYTRACDTLRVILSNFLPVIRENIDPWAVNGLGVDVTREERQQKCIECQRWLLQIRNLPDTNHIGNTLTQLQNLIGNI